LENQLTALNEVEMPAPLRTREDVRRYVAAAAGGHLARHAAASRRQQLVRQVGLLSLLCFAVLQYYFLSIGVEILSMPNLIVFLPGSAPG
jgi:hypothetical protein